MFFDDNKISAECEEWINKFQTSTQDINIYEIYNGNGSELSAKPVMYGANDGHEAVPMEDAPYYGATYGDYTPWAFMDS